MALLSPTGWWNHSYILTATTELTPLAPDSARTGSDVRYLILTICTGCPEKYVFWKTENYHILLNMQWIHLSRTGWGLFSKPTWFNDLHSKRATVTFKQKTFFRTPFMIMWSNSGKLLDYFGAMCFNSWLW